MPNQDESPATEETARIADRTSNGPIEPSANARSGPPPGPATTESASGPGSATDPGSAGPIESPIPDRRSRGSVGGVLGSRVALALVFAVIGGAARLVDIRSAYDIFIDELTYVNVSQNIAQGKGVLIYGKPFDLHPVDGFGVLATIIKLFGLQGNPLDVTLSLRPVPAVLGALTCGVVFLLLDRVVRRPVAMIGALLLAVDPFANLFDSRVLLEAQTQLLAALTILVVCVAIGRDADRSGRRWTIVIGLLAGAVFTTKETFGLPLLAALVVMWATGWVIARRRAGAAAVIGLACFVVYVVAIGIGTGFTPWWNQQGSGFLRLVGAKQVSGFNAPSTHVSFLSRVHADAALYLSTYLILGFGGLATLWMAWRLLQRSGGLGQWPIFRRGKRADGRAVALSGRDRTVAALTIWSLCAGAYLAYALAFGTIEEQMFYITLAPCLILLVVVAAELAPRRRWGRPAISLLAAAGVIYGGVAWARVHTTRDDTYKQLITWAPSHLLGNDVLSATDGSSQFVLRRLKIGVWSTIAQLKANHVDYVVVSTSLIDQGYSPATPAFARVLQQQATVMFDVRGPSVGHLIVYNVDAITGGSRPHKAKAAAGTGAGTGSTSSTTTSPTTTPKTTTSRRPATTPTTRR